MPDELVERPARPWWTVVLRWVFVVLVVGFAASGVRDSWDEIVDAMREVSPAQLAGAFLLVLAGLGVTGPLWQAILGAAGHRPPRRPILSVFYVGQLGKYVPGSVWSMGMQAALARDLKVPARVTVTTSLVFLWVHVASGLLVGGFAATLTDPRAEVPRAVWPSLTVIGAVCLLPRVLVLVARRLAGPAYAVTVGWTDAMAWTGRMLITWLLYAAALVLLLPDPDLGQGALLLAAFSLGYVAGVLIPFLPAGVGAREVVMVGLLSGALGVPAASAVAVLARIVHTIADFSAAALAKLAQTSSTRSNDVAV